MRETGSTAGGVDRATFHIATMDCAAEEAEIRRVLEPVAGIRSLRFQLGSRTIGIAASADAVDAALAAIRGAGFDPQPVAAEASDRAFGAYALDGFRGGLMRLGLALVLATGAEAVALFGAVTTPMRIVEMALAAGAIWLAGLDTYKKGLAALRHGRLDITALMSVAVTGAFLIGQWPEAAMVMALYAIAELIEARSLDRARNAIRELMALAPEQAHMRGPDGRFVTVPARDVPLAATVRIGPGERVPLDGVVITGSSAIDQAPVTGESIPVDKTIGDPVFAGTINQIGEIEVRVTAIANESTLARIIHAVEEAQGTRAPTQRFVDRFAAVYTPSVFVIALAIALGAPWLMDWAWMDALYRALVLLVIACPCALVISTPVTVVSALASAARRGVLVKGGSHLEGVRKLAAVAMDKTGTITAGKPRLVAVEALNGNDRAEVERVAASLAGKSDHPVSRAIAEGLDATRDQVSDFVALVGRGVQGSIAGRGYVLGNHRLIEERRQCGPALEEVLYGHEREGRTVTVLASDAQVLGVFAVADTIKDGSREAIARLKHMGVVPVMLTGDNPATARAIALQAGIDDARGNLLPEDKITAVTDLRERFGYIAMVGDGINDAPALARADVGIAMGAAGADTAMEAADIVIMNDDLRQIAATVRLSQRTHVVLWQNIAFALGIKAAFLGLALFGSATMWMAVFADMGASLLVVGNGLRLLNHPAGDAH